MSNNNIDYFKVGNIHTVTEKKLYTVYTPSFFFRSEDGFNPKYKVTINPETLFTVLEIFKRLPNKEKDGFGPIVDDFKNKNLLSVNKVLINNKILFLIYFEDSIFCEQIHLMYPKIEF